MKLQKKIKCSALQIIIALIFRLQTKYTHIYKILNPNTLYAFIPKLVKLITYACLKKPKGTRNEKGINKLPSYSFLDNPLGYLNYIKYINNLPRRIINFHHYIHFISYVEINNNRYELSLNDMQMMK